MFKSVIATSNAFTPFLIRLTLGIVMFPHGAQKALGWFGGYGWTGTMGYFTGLGLPTLVVALIILGEFLGALGVITGTLTRVAAAGFVIIQAGAVATAHLPFGFFMNWTGGQKGEGIEFGLLAIAMALSLVLTGAGRWSIDRAATSAA